jgi:signal transduction histidine kinase
MGRDYFVTYFAVLSVNPFRVPLCPEETSTAALPARLEQAEQRLAVLTHALARTSAVTGHDALLRLIAEMGETLGARRAHISQPCADRPGYLRFIAMWDGRSVQTAGDFVLAGSASEQVLQHGEQFYWDDLASRFPHNRSPYDTWGVASYLGMPLHGADGRTIGVIAVMFGPDYHDRALAETVLRLFAIRAAGELDGIISANSHRKIEHAFQSVVRGTSAFFGQAFFPVLVQELAQALGAQAVYLTRLIDPAHGRLRRIAGIEHGRLLTESEIVMPALSPTRDTLAQGFLHVSHGQLRGQYPGHPLWERVQAGAFIGVALHSAQGEALGALVLLGLAPMVDVEIARSMLAVFAARAAAEIQRIEADAHVARVEAQLRHAQKLEAIGTLAGGIAHDFNNILTAVLGNAQLAELDADHPDAVRRHLDCLQQGCRRARELVARILTFSGNHDPHKTVCPLSSLVEETIQLLRATLPAAVAIRTDFPPEPVHILGDPDQLHQIVMNLGTNAAHAMREKGGTLGFSIARVRLDEAFRRRHPQLNADHTLCLRVSDTGSGMDAAVREHIFEPFFTTKDVGEGSGLGLAVVHGIVEGHAGAIIVDSVPGQGTTFELYFTEHADSLPGGAPSAGAGSPCDEPLRGTGQRVLVVDDETMITELSQQMLRHLGYEAEIYNDPRMALQAFSASPERFDLLMSDLSMPVLSGMELAQAVLALRPTLPVIIATGFMRSHEIEHARRTGVRYFLPKPFTFDGLGNLLRLALAG